MNPEERSHHLRVIRFTLVSALILMGVRIVFSTPIEIDGDSVGKWISATALASGVTWPSLETSHHTLRWAILLPQMAVSTILPGRYESYFVLPIMFYSFFTAIGMAFIRNHLNQKLLVAPIFLGVLITIDPISHVMASQLKTVSFGLFYFILANVFLAIYVRGGKKQWLLAGAVLVFFSYGSHITYLLFAAGPLFVIVGHRRDYSGGVIFLLSLLALIAFESVVIGLLLGSGIDDGGRLNHLMSGATHQPVRLARGSGPPLEFLDLFVRWRLVPKFDLVIGIAYCCGVILLCQKRIRQEMPAVIWFCFYSGGVYALAVSAPVVGFDPLRLAMGLHTRYLAPAFPLMLIFVVWLIGYYAESMRTWGKIILPAFTVFTSLGFISGCVVYRCASEISPDSYPDLIEESYCRIFRYAQNQNIYPAPDRFLLKAQEYYQEFSEDYRSGVVSLFGGTRIGVLSALIEFDGKGARFVETPNGWFSIDGSDKEFCVMELGQVDRPLDNYRSCGSQPMSRELFN